MELVKYQEKYNKLLDEICGKCSPPKDDPKVHCCYPGGLTNALVSNVIRRKNDFRSPSAKHVKLGNVSWEVKEYHPCDAYDPSRDGCLVYEFRPPICRSKYCEMWDKVDKKVILRGRFNEMDLNGLARHIKKRHPFIDGKYLILTQDPEKVGKVMRETDYDKVVIVGWADKKPIKGKRNFNLDVFVSDSPINSLEPFEEVLEEREAVITDTPLEELVIDDIDDPAKWFDIRHCVLDHYLFIVN